MPPPAARAAVPSFQRIRVNQYVGLPKPRKIAMDEVEICTCPRLQGEP